MVEKPVIQPQLEAVTGQFLVVDAYSLNVRSGPGTNHPVVNQVGQGMQLEVKGSAPGWYYVRLPSGAFGWVMGKYTHLLPSPAQG